MSTTTAERPVSETLKEFGERVRHQREVQNLSQQQLAQRVDISRVWLSKIERGQVPTLSLPLAEKIGRALGLKMPRWISTMKERGSLPRGLKDFVKEAELPEADAEMLSNIHYRGKQPTTAKEWRLLYRMIQTIVGDEAIENGKSE